MKKSCYLIFILSTMFLVTGCESSGAPLPDLFNSTDSANTSLIIPGDAVADDEENWDSDDMEEFYYNNSDHPFTLQMAIDMLDNDYPYFAPQQMVHCYDISIQQTEEDKYDSYFSFTKDTLAYSVNGTGTVGFKYYGGEWVKDYDRIEEIYNYDSLVWFPTVNYTNDNQAGGECIELESYSHAFLKNEVKVYGISDKKIALDYASSSAFEGNGTQLVLDYSVDYSEDKNPRILVEPFMIYGGYAGYNCIYISFDNKGLNVERESFDDDEVYEFDGKIIDATSAFDPNSNGVENDSIEGQADGWYGNLKEELEVF